MGGSDIQEKNYRNYRKTIGNRKKIVNIHKYKLTGRGAENK